MKKINHYVLNGAIALLSTAGFVACSSSDDVTDAPVNPSYDGKSVKTQFAINIADNTPKNSTRMSGANTQQTGYLSMANIYLLPIKTTGSTQIDANTEVLSLIPLNDPNSVSTVRSSHIYSDVNVPIGANNFLFYSTRKDLGADMDNKFKTGSITGTLIGATTSLPAVDNTNDITFALEEILDATNNTSLTTVEGYFETYLNSIKNVADWSAQTGNDLEKLYQQFINFDTEIRAGSAFAVLKLVSDLYDKVKPISENGTDPEKTVAQNIVNAITATTGNVKVEVNSTITDVNPYSLKYSTTDTNITNFPAAQGLPEGAAQLTTSTGDFKYKNQPSIGGITPDPAFNIYNLTYPAPITYFDNTPLKATDKEIQPNDWKTTASDWDSWSEWTLWGDDIKSTSRTVALKNNINYGVACLETTFKCSSAGTLEDNKAAIISGESNQTITVPTNGFPVTGILIGGQPEKVNWQYISESSQNTDYEYVAYDRDLTNIYAVKTGTPATNYTLVLDNYTTASTGQPTVNVAVELVNTAEDFYGKDGLIAKGQKFYLIASLDPTIATSEINWPSYDGTNLTFDLNGSYKDRYPVKYNEDRVFVQDFTTKANFTINNLKSAYVTLPDLRASLLQLGLSVDLKWQSGLTFDVPLGGTN